MIKNSISPNCIFEIGRVGRNGLFKYRIIKFKPKRVYNVYTFDNGLIPDIIKFFKYWMNSINKQHISLLINNAHQEQCKPYKYITDIRKLDNYKCNFLFVDNLIEIEWSCKVNGHYEFYLQLNHERKIIDTRFDG